jgi:hypothetical protein
MSVVVTPSARETRTPRELTTAYKYFEERGPQYVNAETGRGFPPPSRPGTLTKAALSVGMREGEYGGGLREGTLGKTTLRAEKEGAACSL